MVNLPGPIDTGPDIDPSVLQGDPLNELKCKVITSHPNKYDTAFGAGFDGDDGNTLGRKLCNMSIRVVIENTSTIADHRVDYYKIIISNNPDFESFADNDSSWNDNTSIGIKPKRQTYRCPMAPGTDRIEAGEQKILHFNSYLDTETNQDDMIWNMKPHDGSYNFGQVTKSISSRNTRLDLYSANAENSSLFEFYMPGTVAADALQSGQNFYIHVLGYKITNEDGDTTTVFDSDHETLSDHRRNVAKTLRPEIDFTSVSVQNSMPSYTFESVLKRFDIGFDEGYLSKLRIKITTGSIEQNYDFSYTPDSDFSNNVDAIPDDGSKDTQRDVELLDMFTNTTQQADMPYFFSWEVQALGSYGGVLAKRSGTVGSINLFPELKMRAVGDNDKSINSGYGDEHAYVALHEELFPGFEAHQHVIGIRFECNGGQNYHADLTAIAYFTQVNRPNENHDFSSPAINAGIVQFDVHTGGDNTTPEIRFMNFTGRGSRISEQLKYTGNIRYMAGTNITVFTKDSEEVTFTVKTPTNKYPNKDNFGFNRFGDSFVIDTAGQGVQHIMDNNGENRKLRFGIADYTNCSVTLADSKNTTDRQKLANVVNSTGAITAPIENIPGTFFEGSITEKVLNSLDITNIGDEKTENFTFEDLLAFERGSFDVAWNPIIPDEVFYISEISIDMDIYYKAPDTAVYNTWHTEFANVSFPILAPNTKVKLADFSDSSENAAVYYREVVLDNENNSTNDDFNGVYMNFRQSISGVLEPIDGEITDVSNNDNTQILSGKNVRLVFADDPSSQFVNVTNDAVIGAAVTYNMMNGGRRNTNSVIYNKSGGGVAGIDDGTPAGQANLESNKSNALFKISATQNIDGNYEMDVPLNINFKNENFNFVGGLDASQNMDLSIIYYGENRTASVIEQWDSFSNMVIPNDGWEEFHLKNYITFRASRNSFSNTTGDFGASPGGFYAAWDIIAQQTINMETLLSDFTFVTSNNGIPSTQSQSFDLNDNTTIGKVNAQIGYEPSSNEKSFPFLQSEEVFGYRLFAKHTGENNIYFEEFVENVSGWQSASGKTISDDGTTFNYGVDETINLDVVGYDVTKDVEFYFIPYVTVRTSFDGANYVYSKKLNFSNVQSFTTQDENGESVFGKKLTKNYRDRIVPSFSEIEFLEPIDNTPSELGPTETVPQVDVKFIYNKNEFQSSEGNYFNTSRENIRIERVIVQGGEEHVPADETSRIYNDDMFTNLTGGNVPSDSEKRFFIFDDTFSNDGGAFNDIVSNANINTSSVYLYRYSLFPSFVYSPGGGAEKEVAVNVQGNVFDILPENLALAFDLAQDINVNYNSKHSQELTWTYTYSENIDFIRQQGNRVYFEVYVKIREDNNKDDLGREIEYEREKFQRRKSLGWVLSGAIEWDISNYNIINLGDKQNFSHIIRYDRFSHNHRNEIAILLTFDGSFSSLSQSLQFNSTGANTIGISTPGVILEPTDAMKISRHLTEEEKNTSVSRKFTVANQEFDLKNNLEQVPISVTRKKAKVRGNKPYSSST